MNPTMRPSDPNDPRHAAARDRRAVHDELRAADKADLAKVASMLEQSVNEPGDAPTPAMPAGLEERIREKFAKPAPAKPAPAPERPGVFEVLVRFFGRPPVAFGSLAAAAACLVAIVVINGSGGDGSVVFRGDGTAAEPVPVLFVNRDPATVEGIDPARAKQVDRAALLPTIGRGDAVVVVGAEVQGFKAGEKVLTVSFADGGELLDALLEVQGELAEIGE